MTMILPVLAAIFGLLRLGNSSPMKFPFDSNIINVHQAVNYLNSIEGQTWTAGSNSFGEYLSLSEQESRMGSLILKNIDNNRDMPIEISSTKEVPRKEKNLDADDHVFSYDDLPEYYDARKMYPHCTTISSIKDQSRCGSCWAVSTAAAFSDRLCIHSKGMINVNISSNHIISCTRSKKLPANGCHGGWEPEAWGFLESNGAVTGGDYGTFEGCQPYLIKPCGRPDQMPCTDDDDNGIKTPICRRTRCSNEWYEPEGEVYKVKSVYSMPGNITHPNNEIDIRREIYRNGPVTAAFLVYTPLMLYKSGIFQMDFSDWPRPTSGHSVRIVGWGVENKVPYWTVANSWGRQWGEDGTFRILRGKNYCWFESFINSGIPDTPQNIN